MRGFGRGISGRTVRPRMGLLCTVLAASLLLAGCVVGHTTLTPIGNSDVFAGDVQNLTKSPILAHNITVEFLDAQGNVVETQSVAGCLRSLQPGATDFFEAKSTTVPSAISDARAKVAVDASIKLGAIGAAVFNISNVQATLSGTNVTVNGNLKNTTGTALTSPKVCVVLRSSSNGVVRVGSQTLSQISSNGSKTFSVQIAAPPTSADHVDVWADALVSNVPSKPSSTTNISVTGGDPPQTSSNCAFQTTPRTYETTEDRKLYMQAMDLAGNNQLFPGDPFFSQLSQAAGPRGARTSSGDVYVPPTLLKAISWIESVTTQAAGSLPWGAIGPALVSFDCGYGITQVTSGMTAPLGPNGQPSDQQALVATNFAYNIGRGAAILIDKWNSAPANRPIAGIDTSADPKIVENWYYAVWGYNGFTGPGANRSNHPLDPIYGAWPRTPYSCGPMNDGFSHDRSKVPYQEMVYGCMAHPPVVQGQPLWQPLVATLPDLNNPYWRNPLDLKNFVFPYTQMDIPTPKPDHTDPTAPPAERDAVLAQPSLAIDRTLGLVTVTGGTPDTYVVTLSNTGTGIASWRASADKPWITLTDQAGVAVGSDLPCLPTSPCDRNATLGISIDPKQLLANDSATITIRGLGPNPVTYTVAVFVKFQ